MNYDADISLRYIHPYKSSEPLDDDFLLSPIVGSQKSCSVSIEGGVDDSFPPLSPKQQSQPPQPTVDMTPADSTLLLLTDIQDDTEESEESEEITLLFGSVASESTAFCCTPPPSESFELSRGKISVVDSITPLTQDFSPSFLLLSPQKSRRSSQSEEDNTISPISGNISPRSDDDGDGNCDETEFTLTSKGPQEQNPSSPQSSTLISTLISPAVSPGNLDTTATITRLQSPFTTLVSRLLPRNLFHKPPHSSLESPPTKTETKTSSVTVSTNIPYRNIVPAVTGSLKDFFQHRADVSTADIIDHTDAAHLLVVCRDSSIASEITSTMVDMFCDKKIVRRYDAQDPNVKGLSSKNPVDVVIATFDDVTRREWRGTVDRNGRVITADASLHSKEFRKDSTVPLGENADIHLNENIVSNNTVFKTDKSSLWIPTKKSNNNQTVSPTSPTPTPPPKKKVRYLSYLHKTQWNLLLVIDSNDDATPITSKTTPDHKSIRALRWDNCAILLHNSSATNLLPKSLRNDNKKANAIARLLHLLHIHETNSGQRMSERHNYLGKLFNTHEGFCDWTEMRRELWTIARSG